MKKLILLSTNILTINSIQVLACENLNSSAKKGNNKNKNKVKNPNKKNPDKDKHKVPPINETKDFIIDFNSNNYQPIVTSRGWKGTLLDPESMFELWADKNTIYKIFTPEQSKFIKKFTTILHSATSKKPIKNLIISLNKKLSSILII